MEYGAVLMFFANIILAQYYCLLAVLIAISHVGGRICCMNENHVITMSLA